MTHRSIHRCVMKAGLSTCLRWAVLLATAAMAAGCGNKNDAVTQAEKKDVAAGLHAPSIEETKAIAEEGFVYGLAPVMYYQIMYEYAVDPNSGQYKAPFNQIKNEARVYTYEDTAVITPNSDTPYSFAFLDLRVEPIVLSVPAVQKARYISVMLCDGNTFNFGYIGSRATGNEAGTYMVVGPGLERRNTARHEAGVPIQHAIRAGRLPHPAFPSGRYAQRRSRCRRAIRCSRFLPTCISPHPRRPRRSISPKSIRK